MFMDLACMSIGSRVHTFHKDIYSKIQTVPEIANLATTNMRNQSKRSLASKSPLPPISRYCNTQRVRIKCGQQMKE